MKLLKFLPGLSELFFRRAVLGCQLLGFSTPLLDLIAELCEFLFSVLLCLGELFLCSLFFISKFIEACLGLFLLPVACSDFLLECT